MLRSTFSSEELAQLDVFASSPAGIRYYARGLAFIFAASGRTPPAVIELTPADISALDQFAETAAGTKFLKQKVLERAGLAPPIRARVTALIKGCEAR